jgi:nucleoside-diphosphate-sugar epimerase
MQTGQPGRKSAGAFPHHAMKDEKNRVNLLITGAAGNLGGLLARRLRGLPSVRLRLMVHHRGIDPELKRDPGITTVRADLADRETLGPALENIDVVVHFAGVLFRHDPEKFLPVTNTLYFRNLVDAALEKGVRRMILISFPHVEGETFYNDPARGRLDRTPESTHARTRLEEEKILFSVQGGSMEAVSLRAGMVYGDGILMIDAARRLTRLRLLAVWKKPTWIHLISTEDFLSAVENAVTRPGVAGIYHLGDDGVQTLQEFLDTMSARWGYGKPWRLPARLIFFAALCCEFFSRVFKTASPLTRDFIKIGMVSYYGDTSRMKSDLLEELKYTSYRDYAAR